jgi:dihydroflavonol-4-reductase
MKTAFVTGATGFVGSNLVELLVAGGWRVVALHRASSEVKYLRELGIEIAAGDVTDAASVLAAMPEDVDVVFHIAASLSLWSRAKDQQYRINVEGTRNVVAAALARKAKRFVHTSSIAAYGLHREPVIESTPSIAMNDSVGYVRTKYQAEQEVRRGLERGLQAVFLNPANILGPKDRHGWARFFSLIKNKKLPGVPSGAGSFAHVTEVARTHLAAAERGRVGENYLLGGCDATYLEMVQEMARLLGMPAPKRTVPAFVAGAVGYLATFGALFTGREPEVTPEGVRMVSARTTCASDKAERELGFVPRTLPDMIADSYRWLVSEGLLSTSHVR